MAYTSNKNELALSKMIRIIAVLILSNPLMNERLETSEEVQLTETRVVDDETLNKNSQVAAEVAEGVLHTIGATTNQRAKLTADPRFNKLLTDEEAKKKAARTDKAPEALAA